MVKSLIDSIKNWIDRIYETWFGKKYVVIDMVEDDADRETTQFFNNFDELETKDLHGENRGVVGVEQRL